ncbi:MAG: ABC transporter permease [Acidimicrobiia bacterium]
MLRFAIRRVIETVPVLLGVVSIVFLFLHLIPGDAALVLLGERANEASLTRIRTQLGLDQPLYVQYGRYLGSLSRFDIGKSVRTNRAVIDEALGRFPATIELATTALVISSFVGVSGGIIAGVGRGRFPDHVARVFSLLGVSIPIFWLGLVLIWVFAVQLQWLPSDGRLAATTRYTQITGFVMIDAIIQGNSALFYDALTHLALPALALSTVPMAVTMRMTRSAMLEVLRADYIRTARSKGLRERVITIRHAFKNASLPVVTTIGLQVGFLLSGAILTETIFSWPGVGRWVFESILNRDYPIVQGMSLIIATIFVVVNLIVDLIYGALDPRISYR